MVKSTVVFVTIGTLITCIYGRRNNFRPIDLDDLPASLTQNHTSTLAPASAPKSEDFPPLGPPTPSHLQIENSRLPPPRGFSPNNPLGSAYGIPSPAGTPPVHNPLNGAPSAQPTNPSGSLGRLPPNSKDEFPPLGPAAPRVINPQRHRDPNISGIVHHSEYRERSPSLSPPPRSSPALHGRPGSPHTAAVDNSYSHLMLVLQWSGGVCADGYTDRRPVAGPAARSNCLRESKRDHWTIHGLWPSNGQTSPEFCTAERFDGRRLENIKGQLNRYWPSFTSSEDRFFTFWRHEWQKHGTCATDVPRLRGLMNFFSGVLDLFKRHDIKTYLANSNVLPSDKMTYQPTQITRAISDDYPFKVDVVCNRVQSLRQPVLSEIRFCLDKNLRFVNCGGRFIRCGNQFYYPPNK